MARSLFEVVAGRLIVAYFDLIYRLLLGSAEGRRFIALATPPGAPAAHSYVTPADMDELVLFLDLSPGDLALDLGCGFGQVAIALHERTGADVVGLEASSRALLEARRRIAAAGVGAHVRVLDTDITGFSTATGSARAAYEIDALMLTPGHWRIYGSLLRQMGPGSRLFATTLEFGSADPRRTRQRLLDAGLTIETLDDVSVELAAVNDLRRGTAHDLLRSRDAGLRGRLAMVAILSEETLVKWSLRRGLVRRWRISAR